MARRSGLPRCAVAQEYGIADATLARWLSPDRPGDQGSNTSRVGLQEIRFIPPVDYVLPPRAGATLLRLMLDVAVREGRLAPADADGCIRGGAGNGARSVSHVENGGAW